MTGHSGGHGHAGIDDGLQLGRSFKAAETPREVEPERILHSVLGPENPLGDVAEEPGKVASPSMSSRSKPASPMASSAASKVRSRSLLYSRRPTADCPIPEMMHRCSKLVRHCAPKDGGALGSLADAQESSQVVPMGPEGAGPSPQL